MHTVNRPEICNLIRELQYSVIMQGYWSKRYAEYGLVSYIIGADAETKKICNLCKTLKSKGYNPLDYLNFFRAEIRK